VSNTAHRIICDFDRAISDHELKKNCLFKSRLVLLAVPSVNRQLRDKERLMFRSVRDDQMAYKIATKQFILPKVTLEFYFMENIEYPEEVHQEILEAGPLYLTTLRTNS
jgi:hypothetical protein